MNMNHKDDLPEMRGSVIDCVVSSEHIEITRSDSVLKLSPAEVWIQKNPYLRQREVDFLQGADLRYPVNVTDSGDLQQPFTVSNWVFLLVFDKAFPKETEKGDLPVKVYLVIPGLDELQKLDIPDKVLNLKYDKNKTPYLFFEMAERELEQYVNGRHDKLMAKSMILHTEKWTETVQKAIENRMNQKRKTDIKNLFRKSTPNSGYGDCDARIGKRSKYVDGRTTQVAYMNPKCQKVVLSDRAFVQIYKESRSRMETETGGLLLGHFENGIWYVIEASDPGIKAVFHVAYHEGDDAYQNHVCDVISRAYKHPLVFLGMWHRHPGSLDKFSGTDDGTNYKYAGSAGNGCISAIINYDPDFRITFYYAEQCGHYQVKYTKVDVEVGDEKILNREIMELADLRDVKSRFGRGRI